MYITPNISIKRRAMFIKIDLDNQMSLTLLVFEPVFSSYLKIIELPCLPSYIYTSCLYLLVFDALDHHACFEKIVGVECVIHKMMFLLRSVDFRKGFLLDWKIKDLYFVWKKVRIHFSWGQNWFLKVGNEHGINQNNVFADIHLTHFEWFQKFYLV